MECLRSKWWTSQRFVFFPHLSCHFPNRDKQFSRRLFVLWWEIRCFFKRPSMLLLSVLCFSLLIRSTVEVKHIEKFIFLLPPGIIHINITMVLTLFRLPLGMYRLSPQLNSALNAYVVSITWVICKYPLRLCEQKGFISAYLFLHQRTEQSTKELFFCFVRKK